MSEAEHQAHINRKEAARQLKEFDKEEVHSDIAHHVVTLNLQTILTTPYNQVSQLFYKHKLCCYNLTIYSLSDKRVSCYMYVWNETDGKRGSNEIGTCLYQYLKSLPMSIKHLCLYSDSCSGHNQNQFIANLLHYALTTLPNIDHKFFETGHTQMECDSVHAAIEHTKKATSIFVPSQWDTIRTMARK